MNSKLNIAYNLNINNIDGLKIVKRKFVNIPSIIKGKTTLQKTQVEKDYFDTEYYKRIQKNATLINIER